MFGRFPDLKAIDSLLELLSAERERSARAEGIAEELRVQLQVAQNNFEWARVRLNQVEAERSVLLGHFLKLPLVPMVLERQAVPSTALDGAALPFGISFEDMGDDAARREGVEN